MAKATIDCYTRKTIWYYIVILIAKIFNRKSLVKAFVGKPLLTLRIGDYKESIRLTQELYESA